jgi:chaperonin GroEL
MKKVVVDEQARKEVLVGVNEAADITKKTLGLMGEYVVLRSIQTDGQGKRFPMWRYTKDGVSVMRDVFSDDHAKDTGISMVRSACEATVIQEGDGTTVTAILTQILMNLGETARKEGKSPVYLKKGLEQACGLIVGEIKKVLTSIKDENGVINHKLAREVAMISANSDAEIGGIVADAIKSVTSEGMITIEPSNDYKTFVEKTEGVLLSGTIVSPYFINQTDKPICELNNPYILLYDRELSTIAQLKPLIGKILDLQVKKQHEIPLLIICQDCKGEALSFLVTNKTKGSLRVGVVKMSDFGIQKRKVLEDLSAAVGGEFCSEEKGIRIEKIQMSQLGRAEKVIIEKGDTIIITKKMELKDDEGNDKDPKNYTQEEKDYVKHTASFVEYLSQLKAMAENEQNPEDKKLVQERYAKLTGGVAVIRVGGKTQEEVMEKIDRVDDALCASKSALREGIVPGGAVVYLKLAKKIESMQADNEDIRAGQMMLKAALEEPFKQLMRNAGIKFESSMGGTLLGKTAIIETVQSEPNINIGYNLSTDKIEDLLEAGVIDSAGVVRAALENAVSAAGLFLKLGGTIMPLR